ncbi:MAG: F0F1 ATP synthase subunit delta [Thermotogaceae bacterium]|nr:F0F1 ATP synthase subunit delta [Thermotogaceae bacterium]
MKHSALASKYARALINVALESKKVQEYKEMLVGAVTFYEHVREYMNDPTLDPHRQVEKMVGAMKEIGFSVDKPFWNFLLVVFEKKRQKILPYILSYYSEMEIESEMKIPANLTVPYEPTEEEIVLLKQYVQHYTKREPVFEIRIDEALLAGAIVEFEGKMIDFSLQGRIQKMARGAFQKER